MFSECIWLTTRVVSKYGIKVLCFALEILTPIIPQSVCEKTNNTQTKLCIAHT